MGVNETEYKTMKQNALELGQRSSYDEHYNPNRLYPIPRAQKRAELGMDSNALPFKGIDCWNHYEVSWLNAKGKPVVAIAEILYGCNTPYLIESKSLKLYFNSLNNTSFDSECAVKHTIEKDLSACVGGAVMVHLYPLSALKPCMVQSGLEGVCLDDLDVTCSVYLVAPHFLTVSPEWVEETLYSDLLKSNCLVTHQPDWGSVQITYKGPKMNREGLLKYLISFRNHDEFHEQCIERIFMDILRCCQPESLTVYGRYTRRGGLDINPYRSTEEVVLEPFNRRLIRQ